MNGLIFLELVEIQKQSLKIAIQYFRLYMISSPFKGLKMVYPQHTSQYFHQKTHQKVYSAHQPNISNHKSQTSIRTSRKSPKLESQSQASHQKHLNPIYNKIHNSKNKGFRKYAKMFESYKYLTTSSNQEQHLYSDNILSHKLGDKNRINICDKLCEKCKTELLVNSISKQNSNPLQRLFNGENYINIDIKNIDNKRSNKSNRIRLDKDIKSIVQNIRVDIEQIKAQLKTYEKHSKECIEKVIKECRQTIINKQQKIFRQQLQLINAEEQICKLKSEVKKMRRKNKFNQFYFKEQAYSVNKIDYALSVISQQEIGQYQ